MAEENVLKQLYNVLDERKKNPVEGSYTNYLYTQGIDKILKKVGEECTETVIASKNGSKEEMVLEISDLVYHLLVLMAYKDINLCDIKEELEKRRQKIGNKKPTTKTSGIL